MAGKTWTLTDVERDVYVDNIELTADDVKAKVPAFRIAKRTLRGGLRDRVDVVAIDNGLLQLVVVPSRGMGIWRGKCGSLELGWQSPVTGPVHPSLVPLEQPDGLGWLAGFDELLCRCGLESNGAPEHDEAGRLRYPLHGRIANLPAHRVEVSIDDKRREIQLTGVVDEARLFGQKLRMTTTMTTRLGEPQVTIADEIENLSAEAAELALLYHTNFGPPLLEPGARVVVPAKQVVPANDWSGQSVESWDTYPAGEANIAEQVYFFELAADAEGATQVLLTGANASAGVSLAFNTSQLPCFTLWKNMQRPEDGYVTGLEPGTNLPTRRSFEAEQGRLRRLAGGQRYRAELSMTVHTSDAHVAEAIAAIEQLQSGVTPQLHRRPQAGWSPIE